MLSSVVSSLAWPLLVLLAVLILRQPFTALIESFATRKIDITVGGTKISVDAAKQLLSNFAAPLAKSSAKRTRLFNTLLSEPGHPDMADHWDQATEQDETARRAQIEKLMRTALEVGYGMGRQHIGPPDLSLTWNVDGTPQVSF